MNTKNNEITPSFNRSAAKLHSELLFMKTPLIFIDSLPVFMNLILKAAKLHEENYDEMRAVFERAHFLRQVILKDIDAYRSSSHYKKLAKTERDQMDSAFNKIRRVADDFLSLLDSQTEKLEKDGKDIKEEDYMSAAELKAELDYVEPILDNEYRHLIEKASLFLNEHKDVSSLKLQGLSKKIHDAEKLLKQLNKDIDHLSTVQKDIHDELEVDLEDLLKNLEIKRKELLEKQLVKQKAAEISRRQTMKTESLDLGIDFDKKETTSSSDQVISSFGSVEQMDETTQDELLLTLHNENAFGIPHIVQQKQNRALNATEGLKKQKEAELTALLNYLMKIREKIKVWDTLLTRSNIYTHLDLQRKQYVENESDPQMVRLYERYLNYTTTRSNAFKALLNYEIDNIQRQQNNKIQATASVSIRYNNEALEKIVKKAKTHIFSTEVEELFRDYKLNDTSYNNTKISRNIAEKIGITSRISKLKRKIYWSQFLGSRESVNKFSTKLENYRKLLKNEKKHIKSSQYSKEDKEKLISIFQQQIDYSKKFLKEECPKHLTLDRRARRAAKLAGKKMSKKATDLFQTGLEKLALDNIDIYKKLYEPTPKTQTKKPEEKINDEEFINILKKKMSDLKISNPEIYRNYLLGLFYNYKTQYQKLSDNESDLLKHLPENTVKLIQEMELRGLNIDKQAVESAKALFEALFEPEDYDILLKEVEGEKIVPPHSYTLGVLVDPVYNVLLWLNNHNLDLTVKNPIDIITDTNTNQPIKTVELTSFIQSNITLHQDRIKAHLEDYMRIQIQLQKATPIQKVILEKKLYKIEKSVANLLGVRQLNDTLRSEVLLNVALNDRDQKLNTLADHCTTFAVSLATGLPGVKFTEPHMTNLLTDILKKEAKHADEYAHMAADKQLSGKPISAKRAGATLIKQWARKTIKSKDEDQSPPTAAPAA